MSRPLRLELPGALYFVSARGDGDVPIFLKDCERQHFLDLLGREIEQHGWRCHGYCLLTGEYQLLVETPGTGLGRGVGRLNAVYSQWLNRRRSNSGHVFRGRYRAIIADKDRFLLLLARDLAWAPVIEGLVKRPGQWMWSSHRAIGRNRDTPEWLFSDEVLRAFAPSKQSPRKAYRAFVAQGKSAPRASSLVRGQIFLGDDDFVRRAMAQRGSSVRAMADRTSTVSVRPSSNSVLRAVADAAGVSVSSVFDRTNRSDVFQVAVYLLRRAADLPLKEVAAVAGVSPPRVSQIQRAIEDDGGLEALHPWTSRLAERNRWRLPGNTR